jgi:hypothetical protein
MLQINPHTHTYTSILSFHAIYIDLYADESFLDNRNSSTERNERVFTYLNIIFCFLLLCPLTQVHYFHYNDMILEKKMGVQ